MFKRINFQSILLLSGEPWLIEIAGWGLGALLMLLPWLASALLIKKRVLGRPHQGLQNTKQDPAQQSAGDAGGS